MIQQIPLKLIDLNDKTFNISKPMVDETLHSSISAYGIIEPVILIENNKRYTIVYGFNRISILSTFKEASTIKSIVHKEFNLEWYLEELFKKNYNNRISPCGKIKALKIIREFAEDFKFDKIGFLNIPDYFKSESIVSRVLNLSEDILLYLDKKSIGFKDIKNILRLDSNGIELIDRIVGSLTLKNNIFKEIINLLFDITKDEDKLRRVNNLLKESELKQMSESELVSSLRELRYPDYSLTRSKADDLAKTLKKDGIEVVYPPYFEGNEVTLRFKINKSDNGKSFLKSLNRISENNIKELLEIL